VFRDLGERSQETEILDGAEVAEEVRERCYGDLARMHGWLGNHAAILKYLRHDGGTLKTVLDIGCGHGALLQEIEAALGVKAIGVDLQPPRRSRPVTIVRADAIRDVLPAADVAVSVVTLHHFSNDEVAALIRNVGRSCRRFVILDLVRHWMPMALFRGFVAPLVNPINGRDGIRSLERSFTPKEMRAVVAKSLNGSGGRFRHVVAPFYTRQIVDITYESQARA